MEAVLVLPRGTKVGIRLHVAVFRTVMVEFVKVLVVEKAAMVVAAVALLYLLLVLLPGLVL